MTLVRGKNYGAFLWNVFVGEDGGWTYAGATPRGVEMEVWPAANGRPAVALVRRDEDGEVLAEMPIASAQALPAAAPALLAGVS